MDYSFSEKPCYCGCCSLCHQHKVTRNELPRRSLKQQTRLSHRNKLSVIDLLNFLDKILPYPSQEEKLTPTVKTTSNALKKRSSFHDRHRHNSPTSLYQGLVHSTKRGRRTPIHPVSILKRPGQAGGRSNSNKSRRHVSWRTPLVSFRDGEQSHKDNFKRHRECGKEMNVRIRNWKRTRGFDKKLHNSPWWP